MEGMGKVGGQGHYHNHSNNFQNPNEAMGNNYGYNGYNQNNIGVKSEKNLMDNNILMSNQHMMMNQKLINNNLNAQRKNLMKNGIIQSKPDQTHQSKQSNMSSPSTFGMAGQMGGMNQQGFDPNIAGMTGQNQNSNYYGMGSGGIYSQNPQIGYNDYQRSLTGG